MFKLNYKESCQNLCSSDIIDGSLRIVLLNPLQLYDNGLFKRRSFKRLQRKLCMVSQAEQITDNQSSRFQTTEIKEHSLLSSRTVQRKCYVKLVEVNMQFGDVVNLQRSLLLRDET